MMKTQTYRQVQAVVTEWNAAYGHLNTFHHDMSRWNVAGQILMLPLGAAVAIELAGIAIESHRDA